MGLNVNDLTLEFTNGVTAVNHVNLKVTQGIYGLLGENGAGKTTLMRMLTTVLKPTGGTIALDGILYNESNYVKIQNKIGYLPQELELYPNLTVRECLEYLGELSGVPKSICKHRLEEYLERTSLDVHQKKKIRQLSGGMKRRVGLIQALLNEPDFLVVDEPTTGLDPEERIRIRNLLVDFSENRVVLFSTHVIEDLAATCSQLSIMKKGKFLYSGSLQELVSKTNGHVWNCVVSTEAQVRALEKEYHISSKQFVGDGLQVRILSKEQPKLRCTSCNATLEDAYIYQMNYAGV